MDDEHESWDDILPEMVGQGAQEWELRIYTAEIKRSCPKCGATGVKNWLIRWFRALKTPIPAIPGECLRVACIRCGWWFYMETLEQAEKRSGVERGALR